MDFYGTLGPSCQEEPILYEMFREGMTGLRLNLSHKPLSACEDWISQMQRAAKRADVRPQLLIDLQGPELRVGEFAEPLCLEEGQEWDAEALKLPACVMPYLTAGQPLLLDDGKLLAEVMPDAVSKSTQERMSSVTATPNDQPKLRILRGGCLTSRKSIALPGVTIPSPTLTQADLENLQVVNKYGVTGVMLPFVRGSQDLITLRKALQAAGAESVKIYAKLESLEGVSMLEELLPYADEIVIARGDLGNCMDLWHLPAVQKQVAATCRKHQKPFMVVTQMLASMEHAAVPTRAEVSDIFNAVLDGASSVMVTGETAVGQYPIQTIKYLVRTATEALQFQEQECSHQ